MQAYDIMYDIIVFNMIYNMISYMISVRLQPPILPRHSALMQTMVGNGHDADLDRPMDADEERDYADQDPLRLSDGGRCRDSCDTFEAHTLLDQRS